ncbi:MAG: protein kinase domain-containing protein, partial [Planctomycetota bacterium]
MTDKTAELGSYTIERELGRGGMGVVYLGVDPRLGRKVAIKTLPEQLASDPNRLARFEREAKTLASLNHPSIATIHALERADDGTNFLVLEYIEGISLSQRLVDKPISISESLTIAKQIADGLAEAHKQGVIHRDLKPSNIMLLPDNSVKILDFGLAKAAVPADVELSQLQTVSMNVTQAGGVMGTPGYMSPEQARGLTVDTRSDIFSFGCVLFELLTRNTLFAGDTPSDAMAQVLTSEPDWSQLPEGTPTKVLELLIRCLNKDHDERLADIDKASQILVEGIESSRRSSSRVVSLDTPPSNLPASVTSFVGRQRELEELQNSFDHSRIVTLTGSGGCGKTRLGLKFAEQLLNKFPDGVWHVPLASLTGEGITQAVMSALGLKDEKGKSPSETLIDHLREKHILLLFDGCEHILGQCASLVETLLRSGPNICVLITSRQSLGLPGESNYRVPSLSTPDNIESLSPRELMEFESVRLFADRATASCPRFRMSEDLATVIAEIVQKIDGIPLAIELAAARTRAMSLGQIARRLDNSFRLLRGGSKSSLERHQTLQATIDWSHSMLSEEEQILFRRLAVFNGGWTLEAAESVCQGDPIDELDVIDLLSLLVEKSLVNFEEGGEGDRYKLLETVRQYATSKLEESSELESTRRKYCHYFIEFAEEAEPHLRGSVDWLERSGHEIQNLLGAHRACEQLEDGANLDLRLTGAVWRLFDIRGQYALGSSLLNEALARPGAHEPTPARAKSLFGVGVLTMWRGDYDQGKI